LKITYIVLDQENPCEWVAGIENDLERAKELAGSEPYRLIFEFKEGDVFTLDDKPYHFREGGTGEWKMGVYPTDPQWWEYPQNA
jgi:hypothetical protein